MSLNNAKFCLDLFEPQRWQTREVNVGEVGIGGANPIRIQSMTTADTLNTEASVRECIALAEAGCELIRLTAPSKKDAENLREIKRQFRAAGFNTPLVADIHFTPNAAEIAARIVEKVRINPGNYADKKKFESHEYTDDAYRAELDRIREKFTPLVHICREEGTAMRIGTNHGSLSDRILSRYGDTAEGMVESAFEFARIARDEGYHNFVFSMKASNTQVMVHAYRLLAARMMDMGWDYPLHLGVTEAGDGEDGRIKSAVGIGALLNDGLGDTIRVSLTEDAIREIPVAQSLVRHIEKTRTQRVEEVDTELYDPFGFSRRNVHLAAGIGAPIAPRVLGELGATESFADLGYKRVDGENWASDDQAVDIVYTADSEVVTDAEHADQVPTSCAVLSSRSDLNLRSGDLLLRKLGLERAGNHASAIRLTTSELVEHLDEVTHIKNGVLILRADRANYMQDMRAAVLLLSNRAIKLPVVFEWSTTSQNSDEFALEAAADVGGLFLDGLGDGLWLRSEHLPSATLRRIAFGILQAARLRITKTEYIACPSCGRTLFDLQETTAKIRAKTGHLKGLKIGVMGCIVNGPGEMADADYGYVGTGPGKITLYKGQEVVRKNIASAEAVDALEQLIREHGDWVEVEA